MSLVSADSSRCRRRIAGDAPRWGPGGDIIRGTRKSSMTCVACFGGFLISVRIDVAAGAHAAHVASGRDAVIIRTVACLAAVHIPLGRHNLRAMKER